MKISENTSRTEAALRKNTSAAGAKNASFTGSSRADHAIAAALCLLLCRPRRGRQSENGSAPPLANGSDKWEWAKGQKGRNELVLRGNQAEPDAVPCPVHQGKTLKRKYNEDGSWLSHRTGPTSAALVSRESSNRHL